MSAILPLKSSHGLLFWVIAGLVSGLAGGYLSNRIRIVARAKRLIEPTRTEARQLMLDLEDHEKKRRRYENAKQYLQNQLHRLEAEIISLETQSNKGRRQSKRERERIQKLLEVQKLKEQSQKNQRTLRAWTRKCQEIEQSIDACLQDIVRYEHVQKAVERNRSLQGYRAAISQALPLYFLLGFIGSFAITRQIGSALAGGAFMLMTGFFDARIAWAITICVETLAKYFDDGDQPPAWFSWRGFVICGVAMLLLEGWIWLPSHGELSDRLILVSAFTLASGVAGSLSVRIFYVVDRMTRHHFAMLGGVLSIAGIVSSMVGTISQLH